MPPTIGRLRAASLAKESAVGTINATPDIYIPYRPPLQVSPAIIGIESKGIRAQPDVVMRWQQGPGSLNGLKLNYEVEPENIGQLLRAAFGQDTLTGPTQTTVYTHTFKRAAVSQLTSYTMWADVGSSKYLQAVGAMLNKAEFHFKSKEFVLVNSDWNALTYDDTGTSKSPTYSVRKAFKFNQIAVTIGGSSVLIADNLKISVENHVKAEHALSTSIYPQVIFSEGMRVAVTFDLYFQDTVEYAKFLAGTASSLTITITGTETIAGSSPATAYSLVFTIPVIQWTAAPIHPPEGVVKIPFAGVAVYDDGATNKTMDVTLKNSISSAY